MRDVVIGCYFTSQPDPERDDEHWPVYKKRRCHIYTEDCKASGKARLNYVTIDYHHIDFNKFTAKQKRRGAIMNQGEMYVSRISGPQVCKLSFGRLDRRLG